jgi:hypothetical protein
MVSPKANHILTAFGMDAIVVLQGSPGVHPHPAGNFQNLVAVAVDYHLVVNWPKRTPHLRQTLHRYKLFVFTLPIAKGGPNTQFLANTLLKQHRKGKWKNAKSRHEKVGEKGGFSYGKIMRR